MNIFFCSLFLCSFLSVTGMNNTVLSYQGNSFFSDTTKEPYNGILSLLGCNFTIKVATKSDFFLIVYGIDNGNISFEKNGKMIDFERCSKSCKHRCVCKLLEVFKANDIDYNHSACYLKATDDDYSYSYESRSCYKMPYDKGYMIHDTNKCYIEKLKVGYQNIHSIKVSQEMVKLLSKL